MTLLKDRILAQLDCIIATYEHDVDTGKNVEFFTYTKEEYEQAKDLRFDGKTIHTPEQKVKLLTKLISAIFD
jgi:hypothetical protein